MKIWLDFGHGLGNSSAGFFDPGATINEGGVILREAVIVREIGMILRGLLVAKGHEVGLSRIDERTPCPLGTRASRAKDWGADVFVSLHANSADVRTAHGIEIEYRDAEDKILADILLRHLLHATGAADHGNDQRGDLAVLRFVGTAVLIELGFLTHAGDRAMLLDPEKRVIICRAIVAGLEEWHARGGAAPRICPACKRPL